MAISKSLLVLMALSLAHTILASPNRSPYSTRDRGKLYEALLICTKLLLSVPVGKTKVGTKRFGDSLNTKEHLAMLAST